MTHVRAARMRLAPALLAGLLSGCVVVGGGDGGTLRATATAPPPQSAPAGGTTAPAEERIARAIFDRVNAERAERGLEQLTWNAELASVASEWSVELASRGRLEHQDLGTVLQDAGLDGFRALGENIFSATAPVPAGTIHAGWMRSDEHRANVLNPGWDRVGIGVHCAADGSVWAVQEFGRTVDAQRPAVATTTPPREPITRPEDTGPSCG